MRYMPITIPWTNMIRYSLVVFVTLMRVLTAHSCETSKLMDVEALKNYKDTKIIGKVRVFSRPYNSLGPIPMRPQTLAKKWELNINPEKNNVYANSILHVLSNFEICKSQEVPDLYWGIEIYSIQNKKIFSVYFERRYSFASHARGQINGINVSMSEEILGWFESRFPNFESRLPKIGPIKP